MGKDPKNGGGADDLLSKLFELDEGTAGDAPSPDRFNQPTRIEGDQDHTDNNAAAFETPSDQTEFGGQSLDDLLADVKPAAEKTNPKGQMPEAKTNAPEADIFAGILNEEPLSDEKINFFSPNSMKTELKDAPSDPFESPDKTGIISDTDLKKMGESKKSVANPFEVKEKTMILEEVQAPAASDPIDDALNSMSLSKSTGSRPDLPNLTKEPDLNITGILSASEQGQDQEVTPLTEDSLMAELGIPESKEEKKELASSDFSEVFASGPIQVPEVPSKAKIKVDGQFLRKCSMAAGILLVIGGLAFAGWKFSLEDGLMGYRLEGFNIVKSYRAPSEEQRQGFAKIFAESTEARLNDQTKQIESLVVKLEEILHTDPRNLVAMASLAEHSAILMNAYGISSPWTQKFEDYRQKFEAMKTKLQIAKPFDDMDRAMAWKAMALNNLNEAYSSLQNSLKNYTTAEDMTLLLLADLAQRLHKTDESKKYLDRVTNRQGNRAKFLAAVNAQDSSAIEALSTAGYLPAKVETFVRQPLQGSDIKDLLSRSDVLLESVKTAPALSIPIRRFRGELFAELGDLEKARAEWKSVVDLYPKDVETWMKMANSFESEANWEGAIDAYRSAEKAGSSEPRMIVKLARILTQRGRVSEAVKILDQAIAAQSKSAILLFERGRIQLVLYQDEAAKKSFKATLEIQSDNEDAMLGLAEIALRQKEITDAESYFKRINEKSSHYAESLRGLATVALLKRQPDQQKRYLEQALKVNPKYEALYPELVQIHLNSEEDDQAEAILKKGLSLMPRSPLLKVAEARIFQFRGQPDRGLDELEGVAKNYDHLLNLQFALIDLNLDKKDYSTAWKLMNSLIAKEIREPELEFLKAKAYYMEPTASKSVGSNESAVRLLDSAITRDPANIRYHHLSAELNLRMLDKSATLEHIDWAMKIDSHYAPIYLVKGDLHMENGEFEKAALAYQEALKFTRFRSSIYHRLAEAFKRMGKAALAIQYYKKVTSERTQDAEPFLELGKLYNEEGRFNAAMDSFRTAIRLNPKLPEPYYFLGFIQKDVGDRAGAIASFEKFLSLQPNSTESATIRDEVYFLKNDIPQQKN